MRDERVKEGTPKMTNQWHCVAGFITAGCFSTILGHPLDTIKVHQQTNKHLSKVNFTDVATQLARGNVLRLFRGIGAPMANQIIMNTAMFTVFNKVKDVTKQSACFGSKYGTFGFLQQHASVHRWIPSRFKLRYLCRKEINPTGKIHYQISDIF